MPKEIQIQFNIPKHTGKIAVPKITAEFCRFTPGIAKEQSFVTITKETFAHDCKPILSLWRWVGGSKFTGVYIDGELADRQRVSALLYFCQCYNNRGVGQMPHEHCKQSQACPGWGCKLMCWIKRHVEHWYRKEKYWFQVGPFTDGVQYIDRADIEDHLQREVEYKCLEFCPLFSFERVKQEIAKLPGSIDPEKHDLWRVECSCEPGFQPKPIGVWPKENDPGPITMLKLSDILPDEGSDIPPDTQ